MLTAEIEPNDTPAQATGLAANTLVEGTLSDANDVDHFRVVLSRGQEFRLTTFNENAPLFSPTLPPRLEFFDGAGNLLASSTDGRTLSVIAPAFDSYYVAISAENAFGTFVGDYAMQSNIRDAATASEQEPNGLNDALNLQNAQAFRGSISSPVDVDRFRVQVEAGDALVVAFAGLPSSGPVTSVFAADGTLLAQDTRGVGVATRVPLAGEVIVQLEAGNSSGGGVGDYVAIMNNRPNAEVASESGSGLESAHDWEFVDDAGQEVHFQDVAGVLSSTGDVDVFRFTVSTFSNVRLNLELTGGDELTPSGKTLKLYNQWGQLVDHSTNGSVRTVNVEAFAPGDYFLEVSADDPIGLGAYAIRAVQLRAFSLQRDVSTHFLDFDSNLPYQGFDRVNPYAIPDAIDYYVGSFDAKFAPYDVDATLVDPGTGNEIVRQGIGDFGDIGAGGFGGGNRGQRATTGQAVTSARETTANRLASLGTNTVNHEYGHSVGLPHARDVQALMSYVGRTEYLPVGSMYSFVGTDSRRPGTSVNNERNYLDFVLQAGAHVVSLEDTPSNSIVSLNGYLDEMTLDHRVDQQLDANGQPNQVLSGDFNGDGRDDIVVSSSQSGEVIVYITNAQGRLGNGVSTNIGTGLAWWSEPLAVGDFNGDGRDDVAVGDNARQDIKVLLSNANGTLGTPVVSGAGGFFLSTTTADFNGDGILDLAATTGNSQLNLLLGDGLGGFGSPISTGTTSDPWSVDAGDIDGDGDVDLLVSSETSGEVSVHVNTGIGTFTRAGNVLVEGSGNGIAVGDFNGDTAADFAVVGNDPRRIEIFASLADGTFNSTFSHYLTSGGQEIQAEDVDLDGDLDLLVGGFDFTASVLLGDGRGEFTRPITVGSSTRDELSATTADLDNDGVPEIVTVEYRNDRLTVSRERGDDPSNDKVVVFGALEVEGDIDRYSFDPAGETRWDIDIDAAEFQIPLDAIVVVRNAAGSIIARSDDAVDRQSGLASVDPYIQLDFVNQGLIPTGELTIEVSGKNGSTADYRLKLTPGRAMETASPHVIGVFPENGATTDSTNQIVVFLDDILDPTSITSQSLQVTNEAGAIISGTARINPLNSTLIWTAPTTLAIGTYTLTLDGVTDYNGNVLDGEVGAGFSFPDVSGNGSSGGAFATSFTISQVDTTPAAVRSTRYERDPYNRGRFSLDVSDALSLSSVRDAEFILRGAGPDDTFNTEDDTIRTLDAVYDPIRSTRGGDLTLYTQGIPDSGRYRIEGDVIDASGQLLSLSELIAVSGAVPDTVLFTDAGLTTPGLVGSYVDQSLRAVAANEDWRVTQTISGTRTDSQINFSSTGSFGTRADVGVTGGADDDNWDNFSVQWDGYINVPRDRTRLLTRSDDGSRMWIDLDRDGVFGNTPMELVNNGWGGGQANLTGRTSPPLQVGPYAIRIQYEEGLGGESMILEWVVPDRPLDADGFIHGPSVVGTSIAAGAHVTQFDPSEPLGPTSFSVTFSGAINPSTLTPDNLFLRRSPDASLFDNNDEILVDADGVIDWDPATLTATMTFNQPLSFGDYVLEVNGDPGGVADVAGKLLDGEFLTVNIEGNNDTAIWKNTPSGNGIAGGTYRSSFSLSPARLAMSPADDIISERGGSTLVTLSRLYADTTTSLIVSLSNQDRSELSVPLSVTIPAGSESVTFVASGVDDTIIDGLQTAEVIATASGIIGGQTQVSVSDFETITMSLASTQISERGGATELILTRSDPTREQTISLSSNDLTEARIQPTVIFPAGVRTARVSVSAVDDVILDGTQEVTLTASGVGLVSASTILEVADFEQLSMALDGDTLSEAGGTITGVLRRTDATFPLFAQLTPDTLGAVFVPFSVQFLSGQLTSLPFTITGIDNDTVDPPRSVTLVASAPGYQSDTGVVQITDHEPLVVILESTEVSEFEGETTLRVQRTDGREALVGNLSVDTLGLVSFSPVINFEAGSVLSDPIIVTAIDDDFLTGTRTVNFTATAVNHVDGTAELSINDHELLSASIVGPGGAPIDNNEISEASTDAVMHIRVPSPVSSLQGPLTIDLSTTVPQGIDLPDSVVIPVGAASVNVPLVPFDNDIVDGDKDIQFALSAEGYVATSVDASIQDDDTPELSVRLVLPQDQLGSENGQLPEDGGQASLILTRNTISQTTVRLSPSVSDVLAWPDRIVFQRGHRVMEVPLTTVNNQVVDGNRAVTLAVSATGHPAVNVFATVLDDEQAGIVITDANGDPLETALVATEGSVADAEDRTFFVSLAAAPQSAVNLAVFLNPRLSSATSSLTFTPSNWSQPQPVTVSVDEDSRTSLGEQVDVRIAPIVEGTNAAFRNVSPQLVAVDVIDNDEASIIVTESLDTTFASEFGMTDQFFVKLGSQPSGLVRLTFDNSEIASVSVSPGAITFTPDNWDTEQALTVSTDLDFDADGHDIGLVYIDVDPSTQAVGYDNLGRRRLPLIHVDADLSDLRVRRVGNEVVLVDEATDQTLRTFDLFVGTAVTGSRGEVITVDAGTGLDTINLNTAGGDDTVVIAVQSRTTVDGAEGDDTLKIEIEDAFFDPTSFVSPLNPLAIVPRNIEVIDTIGAGKQTLVLNGAAVSQMTDARNDLLLRMDDTDILDLGNGWQVEQPVLTDGIPSHRLTSGNASLRLAGGSIWQNPILTGDVDINGEVTARDALMIINRLNATGEGEQLPNTFDDDLVAQGGVRYYDVTGDGMVTALDALRTINYLNAMELGSENVPNGESIVVSALPTTDTSLMRQQALAAANPAARADDDSSQGAIADIAEPAAFGGNQVDRVFAGTAEPQTVSPHDLGSLGQTSSSDEDTEDSSDRVSTLDALLASGDLL